MPPSNSTWHYSLQRYDTIARICFELIATLLSSLLCWLLHFEISSHLIFEIIRGWKYNKMKFHALLLSASLLLISNNLVDAKARSSRSASGTRSATSRRSTSSKKSSSKRSGEKAVQPVPDPSDYDDDNNYDDEYYNASPLGGNFDEYDNQYDNDDLYDNDYDQYERIPPSRRGSSKRVEEPSSRMSRSSKASSSHGGHRGKPNGRSSSRSSRSMTAYRSNAKPQPSAFAKSLQTLRNSIPDPATIKSTTLSGLSSITEASSKISSNLYREIKGLTSSELEQVMLKATMPNDTAVKGKHVERLVGVTYQISGRYDIYDAVLRKLWGKMCEKDWRTVIKVRIE